MISVVMPICVPWAPLESALCALNAVRAASKFEGAPLTKVELIVVDDSETTEAEQGLLWSGFLEQIDLTGGVRYLRSSPPRMGRFTASRARNIGAANARGDLLVFLDQDVMIAPWSLYRYWQAYQRHGDNVVIVGLYHWMRNIDFKPCDVEGYWWTDIVDAGLGSSSDVRFPPLPMDEPGLQGIDHRNKDFKDDIENLSDDASLGAHTGNLGVPRRLFLQVGGFDEAIVRHGGEDADFGLTCKAHGAKWLLWNEISGVHRWHPRDQAQNAEDVQTNIDYIDRKHGIGQYADAKKWMDARDWSDPRHYHKDVGGVLMQASNGDSTVWVCRDGHRMGLPSPAALKRLGFAPEQVMMVPASSLEKYAVEGVVDG